MSNKSKGSLVRIKYRSVLGENGFMMLYMVRLHRVYKSCITRQAGVPSLPQVTDLLLPCLYSPVTTVPSSCGCIFMS